MGDHIRNARMLARTPDDLPDVNKEEPREPRFAVTPRTRFSGLEHVGSEMPRSEKHERLTVWFI
jgi:hypothetical protein